VYEGKKFKVEKSKLNLHGLKIRSLKDVEGIFNNLEPHLGQTPSK